MKGLGTCRLARLRINGRERERERGYCHAHQSQSANGEERGMCYHHHSRRHRRHHPRHKTHHSLAHWRHAQVKLLQRDFFRRHPRQNVVRVWPTARQRRVCGTDVWRALWGVSAAHRLVGEHRVDGAQGSRRSQQGRVCARPERLADKRCVRLVEMVEEACKKAKREVR